MILNRSLNLAGATNFRDLGGYRTTDGRTTRWRRLFRSDHLGALTEQDRATLAELGVTRSFDFRGVDERANTPYEVPGLQQHSLAIEPSVVQNLQLMSDAGRALDAGAAVEVMQDTYRAFVTDYSERFARLLAHLLEDDSPSVFHCTAGKDRTGFAAMLILSALHVPHETIVDDFLLTNQYFKRQPGVVRHDLPEPVTQVLWGVQRPFLDAALQAVEQSHGGVDGYLRALGVGEAEKRQLARAYLT